MVTSSSSAGVGTPAATKVAAPDMARSRGASKPSKTRITSGVNRFLVLEFSVFLKQRDRTAH